MSSVSQTHADALGDAMHRHWGYDSFRPLQQEAMLKVMAADDSLVVLPTGGGKSLCYQVPAVCLDGLAVVVSPLISLMKDQVDALTGCGVSAACVNSTLSVAERRRIADRVSAGEIRLLYMAPERLVQRQTLAFLESASLSFIAIDEAHCVSQWGHDFRPEYRQLSVLREAFPDIGMHAFTATATETVRDDIVESLNLHQPAVLVGSFDRPNLIYRVEKRKRGLDQITEVMDRHPDDSGIVYCISRAKVEQISEALNAQGYRTRPYHAGLTDEERQKHQNEFIAEEVQAIVATVAFGMGIDKSNVRYVVHAAMPKSLEHYQQEAGRAGRDGLEADCALFFSMSDFNLWQRILLDGDASNTDVAMRSLRRIADYCGGVVCRHRMLVEHFGETWTAASCGACDVCLGDLESVADPLVVGQKILSSVIRQGERFGGDYTALVLGGSSDQRVLANRHDQLSTYGLLREHSKRAIRDWIEQLVAQQFLQKTGEYNVLSVTESGRELLRGELMPRLLKATETEKERRGSRKSVRRVSWEDVDRVLFERLRELRRQCASERGVPPYIVFGDASLREMAARQPRTSAELRTVKGVGDKKLADYGEQFLAAISNHAQGIDPEPAES